MLWHIDPDGESLKLEQVLLLALWTSGLGCTQRICLQLSELLLTECLMCVFSLLLNRSVFWEYVTKLPPGISLGTLWQSIEFSSEFCWRARKLEYLFTNVYCWLLLVVLTCWLFRLTTAVGQSSPAARGHWMAEKHFFPLASLEIVDWWPLRCQHQTPTRSVTDVKKINKKIDSRHQQILL